MEQENNREQSQLLPWKVPVLLKINTEAQVESKQFYSNFERASNVGPS
ncbi:hypothetical protein AQ14_1756 [Francisella tularensis subsp. novicida D9876]|nr:hypothetical protein AQ14_1756 [Francisella tularensis subsp. novicida D9876]